MVEEPRTQAAFTSSLTPIVDTRPSFASLSESLQSGVSISHRSRARALREPPPGPFLTIQGPFSASHPQGRLNGFIDPSSDPDQLVSLSAPVPSTASGTLTRQSTDPRPDDRHHRHCLSAPLCFNSAGNLETAMSPLTAPAPHERRSLTIPQQRTTFRQSQAHSKYFTDLPRSTSTCRF